jgi:hypothetical protein
MNTFKAFERTYNAAITGLSAQQPPSQAEQEKWAERIVLQANLIASKAVPYIKLASDTVNQTQGEAVEQVKQNKALPYAHQSNR